MIRPILTRAVIACFAVVVLSTSSGRAQSEPTSDVRSDDSRQSWLWNYSGTSYGYYQLGGMSFSDSVRTQRWLGYCFGGNLFDQRLGIELEFHFIRIVQLRGRGGHHRVAVTPLAQTGVWLASRLLLHPIDSTLGGFGALLGMAMGGTNLAFHISDAVQM